MSDKDPPIEPQEYLGGVTIVDIGDARVARGMSRRPVSTCKHRRTVYDQKERRIWCSDCQTNVDPFDAFLMIIKFHHDAAQALQRRSDEIEAAKRFAITRIAAKNFEQAFRNRSHVPTCPHCHLGILPEDTAHLGMVGREWELARRAKASKP